MKAWIRVVDAAGRPTPMLTVEGSYPGSADQPSVDFTAMTGWSIGFDESRLVSLRIVPAVRERWPEVTLTFQASSAGWSVSYHAVDVKVTVLGDEATLTITQSAFDRGAFRWHFGWRRATGEHRPEPSRERDRDPWRAGRS